MRPIMNINNKSWPPKQRAVTIYKRGLFEEMDAMSYRFSSARPDLPSLEAFASATQAGIQDKPYELIKERQVTASVQNLLASLNAETRKFAGMRPDQPSAQSDAVIGLALPFSTKERVVTIYKQKLYEDIDSESYKFTESRPEQPAQQGNAIASDTAEKLDGHIIARLVENCDARLRRRLKTYLKNDTTVSEADNELVLDAALGYTFILSTEFPDTMLEPLKNYIHHYLVWGALSEWYGAGLGSEQANWFSRTLKETEDAIIGLASQIDGLLAIRHLKFADAHLRKRLVRFLKNTETVLAADDNLESVEAFVYEMLVPTEFNDSQMGALAEHIHRYLVWAALFDWYGASLGAAQSAWFEKQLKGLGDAIVMMVSRVDALLAVRYLEFRDARLRRRIARFLSDFEEVTEADDQLQLDSTFVYDLWVPADFKDALLDPLKDHIHRYLLWGALFTLYGHALGSDQARLFAAEVDSLENDILNLLRGGSLVRRPLQPFGPAEKIYW